MITHFCTTFERNHFPNVQDSNVFIFPPMFVSESEYTADETKSRSGFLFVSRNDAHKGFTSFLDAARKLPSEPFVAVVDKLRGEAIPENVTVYQRLSAERLNELYRGSRALIFPSAYESFGGVLVEALAMGAMVICSERVLAVEYFSTNQNVLVYKFGTHEENVDNIVERAKYILSDAALFSHYGPESDCYNGLSRAIGQKNMRGFYAAKPLT